MSRYILIMQSIEEKVVLTMKSWASSFQARIVCLYLCPIAAISLLVCGARVFKSFLLPPTVTGSEYLHNHPSIRRNPKR
ncbi:hypothetical protein AAC387_Pa02g2734 [Persea americana]